MAIVVWTDCYATVAQMDTLLRANVKWTSLQVRDPDTDAPDPTDTDGIAKKEAYIKAATQAIDYAARYWGGTKADDAQALQFPRDFGAATDDPMFVQAGQLRELVTATAMQINADLAPMHLGTGSALATDSGGLTAPGYPQLFGVACRQVVQRLMIFADRSL